MRNHVSWTVAVGGFTREAATAAYPRALPTPQPRPRTHPPQTCPQAMSESLNALSFLAYTGPGCGT